MNHTILITGSSSGIGKATAKHFHDKGWNVVATMRAPEQETELTQLNQTLVQRLDVQDQASIHSAVAAGIEKFGKIDVLLNNAGYGSFGPLEAATDQSIRRQFDVNVIGLLDVTRAILPHFRQNKNGVLINVSSIGGKMTFPLLSLYHGTKFAVEGISEALSFELAEIGVRVKIIEPGAIKTDFGGRSLDFFNDESLQDYQGLVNKVQTAFAKFGEQAPEPTVVAEVIYQAATDGTDTLRYSAGEDAAAILKARQEQDDATFITELKKNLGL